MPLGAAVVLAVVVVVVVVVVVAAADVVVVVVGFEEVTDTEVVLLGTLDLTVVVDFLLSADTLVTDFVVVVVVSVSLPIDCVSGFLVDVMLSDTDASVTDVTVISVSVIDVLSAVV